MYLPKEWAEDDERREEAGVPRQVRFATKIALARRMVERAVAAGVTAAWVTADAVYGSDYGFRSRLEGRGLGYVVGVRADFAAWRGLRQVRAKALLAEVPAGAWRRLSCGDGSKGPRLYDWAALPLNSPEPEKLRPLAADPAEHLRPVGRGVLRVRRAAGRERWRSWFASPGRAGRSRICSSWPRAIAGWTSTRCGVGSGGIGTSP